MRRDLGATGFYIVKIVFFSPLMKLGLVYDSAFCFCCLFFITTLTSRCDRLEKTILS